ncbi:MAG: hypothetical protein AB7J32_09230 [Pseudonocardia sp.]
MSAPAPVAEQARARPGSRAWLAPAACVLAAVASLRVPAMLGFDPWVWLIWGRELLHGLPTNDGSLAWKPLPVLVTVWLAPFGDAAPALWLVISRAAGLFGLVLLWRLAARLAGPPTAGLIGVLAGAFATAAFLLTPDAESRWIRHLLQGNIEPVTVMLCLWAVHRHLDGRRGQALVLGGAAGLTRPEVWPLLTAYAVFLLVTEGRRRWWQVAFVLAAVPVLWFGGDRLVSGDALGGAEVARVLQAGPAQRVVVAMDAAAAAVIVPVWIGAAVAVVWAAQRRRPVPVVLAAGALVWVLEVVVMAGAFGYAALGRFYAPVSAVLCVLAGVAVGWLAASVRGGVVRVLVVVAVVVASLPFATQRVAWLPAQLDAADARAAMETDLDGVLARPGPQRILACGSVVIDTAAPNVELRPGLAWKLGLPIGGVVHTLPPGPAVAFAQAGGPWEPALVATPGAVPLARSDRWAVYAIGCP